MLSEESSNILHQLTVANALPIFRQQIQISGEHQGVFGNAFESSLAGESFYDEATPEKLHSYIAAISPPSQLTFKTNDLEYFGGGVFSIPFEAEAEADLNYPLYKADYYIAAEEKLRDIAIYEDLNDHYFDVEEACSVSVEGTATFSVEVPEFEQGQQLDIEAVNEILQTIGFDDISFEIVRRTDTTELL